MPAPRQPLVPGHPFPESSGPGRLCDVLLAEVGWNSPGIHLLGSARAPHHVPGPRLVPGAALRARESSALIAVPGSCWGHLQKLFLPFLGFVFWIVFSSVQLISTFSTMCIQEAPLICINHI